MSKLGKAKGCLGGVILGSALRAIVFIVNALVKAVASIMVFFGLWAPFVYALLGGILYLAFGFDPLSGSVDSKIFLVGFAGTVLCALLITVKHLFEKPAKSVAEGFKKPIWEKHRDEEEDREEDYRWREPQRRQSRRFEEDEEPAPPSDRRERPRENAYQADRAPAPETPQIYYSARERNTLVHEYSDRFEVFRIVDGRTVLDKVEYKNL